MCILIVRLVHWWLELAATEVAATAAATTTAAARQHSAANNQGLQKENQTNRLMKIQLP